MLVPTRWNWSPGAPLVAPQTEAVVVVERRDPHGGTGRQPVHGEQRLVVEVVRGLGVFAEADERARVFVDVERRHDLVAQHRSGRPRARRAAPGRAARAPSDGEREQRGGGREPGQRAGCRWRPAVGSGGGGPRSSTGTAPRTRRRPAVRRRARRCRTRSRRRVPRSARRPAPWPASSACEAGRIGAASAAPGPAGSRRCRRAGRG